MSIDELLIDFDEMGFVPTTLCKNPDEYAQDWKKKLLVEINRLEKHFAEELKEKALLHCKTINCYECKFIETTIDELLKEYENGKQI